MTRRDGCGGSEVVFGLTTAQPLSNPRLEDRDSSDNCSDSKKHDNGNAPPQLDSGNHANSIADPRLYALGRFARRRLLWRVIFLNHVKNSSKSPARQTDGPHNVARTGGRIEALWGQ